MFKKATDLLSGVKILEVANSPINGRLICVRDLTWGVHIQANGTTQSGGIAEYVWKNAIQEVAKSLRTRKVTINSVLLLGLGGGTIAKLVNKNWPEAKVVGVDIDPIIVRMGKDYMHLDTYNVETHIEDIESYAHKEKRKFDLVCVDIYQGDKFPEKFATEEFMMKVSELVSKNGIVVINRLYGGEHRKSAVQMLKKLEKIFSSVDPVYPEANVMFVCQNK
jgi:spermidine synthase